MSTLPFSIQTKISLLLLIASNASALFGIFFLGWNQGIIVLAYWIETVVIGLFTVLKMAKTKKFGEEIIYNRRPLRTKNGIVVNFIYINVLFLLGFLLFIAILLPYNFEFKNTLPLVAMLVISHGVSYLVNFLGNKEYLSVTLKQLYSSTFGRIFLISFVITLGAGFSIPAIFLIIIKTIADAYGHLKEHRVRARL